MKKQIPSSPIDKMLEKYKTSLEHVADPKREEHIETVGFVEEIGDGVAYVSGLSSVMYNELLMFPKKTLGLVLNLEENRIGVILLGRSNHIKQGDMVRSTGRLLNVPVGNDFIGRVVNPLGQPLDGKVKPQAKTFYPIERIAPGVIDREPVNTPLQTGIKAIDSMIPIGLGQRELIIGDRGTGKSSLAIT